jgi:hypothetical protein
MSLQLKRSWFNFGGEVPRGVGIERVLARILNPVVQVKNEMHTARWRWESGTAPASLYENVVYSSRVAGSTPARA